MYNLITLQAYDHFLKASDKEPDVMFPCSECSKVFKSKRMLSDHALVHRKVYQCLQCPKKMPTPSTLKGHMFKHTSERPFPCQFCDYKGKNEADMKSHKKRHQTQDRRTYCKFECGFSSKKGIHLTMKNHYQRGCDEKTDEDGKTNRSNGPRQTKIRKSSARVLKKAADFMAKRSKSKKLPKTGDSKKPRGASIPLKVSPVLANIIGTKEQEQVSIAQVMKRLWLYLKLHKLQDPQNGQYFTPDEKMAPVFGKEKLRAFGMLKHLKVHLTKPYKIKWKFLDANV